VEAFDAYWPAAWCVLQAFYRLFADIGVAFKMLFGTSLFQLNRFRF
jgi:hypothetical protein